RSASIGDAESSPVGRQGEQDDPASLDPRHDKPRGRQGGNHGACVRRYLMASYPSVPRGASPLPSIDGLPFDLDLNVLTRFLQAPHDFSLGCAEVRILTAKSDRKNQIVKEPKYKSTYAAWFDDIQSIAREITRVHNVSTYLTVNPVKHDLLA